MPDDLNPYEPPQAPTALSVPPPAAEVDTAGSFAALGRVVVTWEKLRLVYNVVVGVAALLLTMLMPGHILVRPQLVERIVEGAIFANLCYCAGPMIDGYLTWFGVRHPLITAGLFAAGTFLTVAFAAAVLL